MSERALRKEGPRTKQGSGVEHVRATLRFRSGATDQT
jgi:hypothetical protein